MCHTVVKRAWEDNSSQPSTMRRTSIGRRLINTVKALTRWNKESFGMCKERILFFEDRIQWLQSLQPTEDIINQERRAQEELSEWLNRQEIIKRQKSRDLRLKIFHASTINNRRKIYIASLKNNEEDWMETRNQIGDFLVKEFTNLFRAETINHDQPVNLFFQPIITEDQNAILKRIPSRDEVLKAVKSLHPIKAPGPDGMSALFFPAFLGYSWQWCFNYNSKHLPSWSLPSMSK